MTHRGSQPTLESPLASPCADAECAPASSIESLNETCYCVAVDQASVQASLRKEYGEIFSPAMWETHPHLFATSPFFVGEVALQQMTEVVAAIACLLLPVVVLVGTLPTWMERKHAATIAAREAAAAVLRDPGVDAAALADDIAANYGIETDDVDVRVAGSVGAGSVVTVEVDIRMPAIGAGPFAAGPAWTYTAVQRRRVDDYRSS